MKNHNEVWLPQILGRSVHHGDEIWSQDLSGLRSDYGIAPDECDPIGVHNHLTVVRVGEAVYRIGQRKLEECRLTLSEFNPTLATVLRTVLAVLAIRASLARRRADTCSRLQYVAKRRGEKSENRGNEEQISHQTSPCENCGFLRAVLVLPFGTDHRDASNFFV